MGAPRRLRRQEASSEVPVPDVSGHRDEAAGQSRDVVDAADRADVPQEPLARLTIRREQVAEAHGEVAKDLGGQLVEPCTGRAGDRRERSAHRLSFGRQETQCEPTEPAGE